MDPQYAEIVSGTWSYRLTPDDVLWAARMASYEGGDPAASLWTLTSRYALPDVHERYASLGALLQAFSQPINPKWRRDGEFCREGSRYHGTDTCSEGRLRRRDEAATASWEALRARNSKDVATVEKWAVAGLENPAPRAVNFAAPAVASAWISRNPGSVLVLEAGNWFMATAHSAGWPKNQVTMRLGDRVVGDAPRRFPWSMLVMLLAIIGGGLFAYRWWNLRSER